MTRTANDGEKQATGRRLGYALIPSEKRDDPYNEIGNAEKAFGGAAFKVDSVYHSPRHNHTARKPHATTILWDGGRLIIHNATQAAARVSGRPVRIAL